MDLTLTSAVVVLLVASGVIMLVGPRMVSLSDRLADATGWGEALVGAVVLGAATSLPDIVATAQPALSGFAEQAAGNALGGILIQTAFLAIADITYRRANLEHATASLPNLVQASVLVALLSLVAVAVAAPTLAWGPVHVVTIALPLVYWYGMRVVSIAGSEPLWEPVVTSETRQDEPDPDQQGGDVRSMGVGLAGLAVVLGIAGWLVGEAGQVVVVETGLSQGAVGALLTASATSVAELVVSVAAIRRGALALAVGTVIGGNSFDTLLMVVADLSYTSGPVYAEVGAAVPLLVAVGIAMTTVLILGMLRRQRSGVGNIGTESAAVLVLYAVAAAVLL